jgi:hypothetical protein
MGLPYEAPSGGYEDDSTSPDAGRYTDDLTTPGYDGYSHDATSAGEYQDADEYDFDEDEDEDEDEDDDDLDLEEDELDEGGLGGQAGWDPGAGRTGGRDRM